MKFDKKYFTLIKHLIKEGIPLDRDDGIEIKSIPFYNLSLDLKDEFPISRFSNISFEEEVLTMLWNFQMMSNDVRELHKRGIHKLDEYMIDSDGIYRMYKKKSNFSYKEDEEQKESVAVYDYNGNSDIYPRFDDDGYMLIARSLIPEKSIESALYYGSDFSYTTGTSLGYVINHYNLSRMMEEKIKNRDIDSYETIDFNKLEFANTSTYDAGICSCSWFISSNKLNFNITLRNINLLTELPNLIVQYSTLLMMMASVSKLDIGKINFSIENVYVELCELEKLNKQLDRWNIYQRMTRYSKGDLEKLKRLILDMKNNQMGRFNTLSCSMYDRLQNIEMILNPITLKIWVNPEIDSFFDFDNYKLRDTKLRTGKERLLILSKFTF